jgi:hypothetical protein
MMGEEFWHFLRFSDLHLHNFLTTVRNIFETLGLFVIGGTFCHAVSSAQHIKKETLYFYPNNTNVR